MQNSQYWANRMRMLEDSLLDTGYEYTKNLERQYDIAIQTVEAQTARWYQRFADNQGISLAEANRMLNAKELEEFHWSVEDYIQHGEENAISGAWKKQLENASARAHISRLDSLKIQLQQQAEMLHGAQKKTLRAALSETYQQGYYRTAYEVQKGTRVGWTLHGLDDNVIRKALARPWTLDGQTFSDRIWTNKQALVGSVNTQLTQMLMRGAAPDAAIKAISNRFQVSKSQAGRLVMTETAALAGESRKDCFRDLGVAKYEIVESLDSATCSLCAGLDGKVYAMKEYQTGVTAPPFHPWCRGTTAPYFEDMKGFGERAARGEDGKTYYVPADTTYEEWKKAFVRNEQGLSEKPKHDKIKLQEIQPEPTKDIPRKQDEKVYKTLTQEEFKAIHHPITQAERKIIYGRTHLSGYVNSSNARKMNALLREGKELPENYKEIEQVLKIVIERHTLPDDILTTRYVAEDALEGMFGVSVPKGKPGNEADEFWKQLNEVPQLLGTDKEYIEKGFLSVSGVADKNVMTNKKVKMLIKIPKGTHAYVTTNVKESEIILNEGTKLNLTNSYVEKMKKKSGKMTWKVVLECEIR